jgi:hypothetical protein
MPNKSKTTPLKARTQAKIKIDLQKFKAGTLHSGPGKKHVVQNKKQALAIAYSQARKGKK